MTDDKKVPGYQGRLNEQCLTFAEVLKPAGYFSAMVGKWHVGQNHGVTPWGRGFDRSLNAAAGGFYFPASKKAELFLNGQAVLNDDPPLLKDWYSTDLWTDQGLKVLSMKPNKPTSRSSYTLPTTLPIFRCKLRRRNRQVSWTISGWLGRSSRKATVETTLARYHGSKLESCTATKHNEKNSTESAQEDKDRFDHLMATYAACVHRMDKAVGDLVSGLKARGASSITR